MALVLSHKIYTLARVAKDATPQALLVWVAHATRVRTLCDQIDDCINSANLYVKPKTLKLCSQAMSATFYFYLAVALSPEANDDVWLNCVNRPVFISSQLCSLRVLVLPPLVLVL
jgi:hypothetical protein